MRVSLLGGTGFVGEYLAKKLSNRKNCEIVVVCSKENSKLNCDNIKFVKLDLTRLSKQLEKLINSSDIVIVLTQPNIKIIENLISVIRAEGLLKKIVYLSSTLIYDNSDEKQSEKFPVNPITDYERGKCEEELILSKFIQGKNLKLCITRLANVYGDVKNRGLINYIFLSILNNGKMTINGKGSSVRDYIFIEDVVAWLDFLIFRKQLNKKEVINLCTGSGYSVREVLKRAERVIGKKANVVAANPIKEKAMIIGDNKEIIGISGINFKYNLNKGLQQAYKNYLK